MVTTSERVHSWPPVDAPFQVVMTYGSTETTNALTCLDIGAGLDFTASGTAAEIRAVRPVPVGRPIANMRAYLLDPLGTPVPVGVVGRLHVAGVGLAAGYYQRPDLTAQKFHANTVPEEPDAILYDTGDLARYRADGVIELLGRADSQVKIRGFRVEIGEVEKTINAAPGVAEAVVATYEPSPGDLRLVAYVAAAGAPPVAADVRSFVTGRLPHYMVPSLVMTMDKLPRLANGKVDHQSLPAPEESVRAGLTTEFIAPTDPVEKELARIWSDALHVQHIGSTDNFFELGGHSLLAVRMMADAASTFNVELRLPDLCSHPTIGALAALVAAKRSAMDQDAI
jgi:acyl-CoA synthetase (AMP-forming)/AMP-acid ligase II/acyl carrier protein